MAATILVVEDEPAIQTLIAINLKRAGHEVVTALDAETAQRQVNEGLQYQREAGSDPPLLHQPGDPMLEKLPAEFSKFTAARSLRDVEPAVDLWIRNPDGFLVESEDEEERT